MIKKRIFFLPAIAALGVFGIISIAGAAGPGLTAGPDLTNIAKKNDAGIILTDFPGTRATGDAGSSGAPTMLRDGITYQLAAVPPKKADPKKKATSVKKADKKMAAPKKPRMTAKQKRAAAAKAKAEQEAKAKATAAKMKVDADRRAKCDADAGCRFGRMMRCRVFTGGEGAKADICV